MPKSFEWSSLWVRWSVLTLIALTLGSLLIGFLLLPSVKGDFSAQGLWDSVCRAAGVPSDWGSKTPAKSGRPTTNVVLARSMANPATAEAIGRGGTLALNCTMCHGAQGMSASDAPNLAGQYPEVIVKQLMDYRSGNRSSAIMVALAKGLSERDIADLAAYYSYLPKARTSPTTYDDSLPALVRVGAPLRNIAPCVSCHGGIDQKFGAPWLEGMPANYLVGQLQAFRSGLRQNDSQAQMRNVVRSMTDHEIAAVAAFYARKGGSASENR